jgi:hypothetical protein
MEYCIVVSHGVASFPCLDRRQNVKNTEESMPCAASTKIKPDSRGPVPAISIHLAILVWHFPGAAQHGVVRC